MKKSSGPLLEKSAILNLEAQVKDLIEEIPDKQWAFQGQYRTRTLVRFPFDYFHMLINLDSLISRNILLLFCCEMQRIFLSRQR